jgi:hypothetical protein
MADAHTAEGRLLRKESTVNKGTITTTNIVHNKKVLQSETWSMSQNARMLGQLLLMVIWGIHNSTVHWPCCHSPWTSDFAQTRKSVLQWFQEQSWEFFVEGTHKLVREWDAYRLTGTISNCLHSFNQNNPPHRFHLNKAHIYYHR